MFNVYIHICILLWPSRCVRQFAGCSSHPSSTEFKFRTHIYLCTELWRNWAAATSPRTIGQRTSLLNRHAFEREIESPTWPCLFWTIFDAVLHYPMDSVVGKTYVSHLTSYVDLLERFGLLSAWLGIRAIDGSSYLPAAMNPMQASGTHRAAADTDRYAPRNIRSRWPLYKLFVSVFNVYNFIYVKNRTGVSTPSNKCIKLHLWCVIIKHISSNLFVFSSIIYIFEYMCNSGKYLTIMTIAGLINYKLKCCKK